VKRLLFPSLALAAMLAHTLGAEVPATNHVGTTNVLLIDFPTALQLAGARSLDLQIAREKLAEAKAAHESSVMQFFPSMSPGIGYRRHDNLTQNAEGAIIDVHKDSYAVGPVIAAQVDLGDAIYRNLALRQLVKAAEFGVESQRQESILAAALGYFDLAKAQAAVAVAQEAVRISQDYAEQVRRAVDAGVAFRGDALRVQVQSEKSQLTLRQTQEQRGVATARLVQTLHLEGGVKLATREDELAPLALVATNSSLGALLAQAFSTRPELAQSRYLIGAAREARKGAVYGPLIPSVGAQVFAGGFGGGSSTSPEQFGASEDYQFTLGWRIGPGGLFDRGRVHASDARLRISDLSRQKLADEVTRQVTEGFTRWQSSADQMSIAWRAVQAAEETLRLTQQRKEFAVGAVLETIQAEQDLTGVRLDYLNALAEFNKAQYALSRAIGGVGQAGPSATGRKESK
jgi:outer membrane protein TolC